MALPSLPAPIGAFLPYLATQPDVATALKPYKDYEGKLREVFAQHRDSAILDDHHINTLSLFAGHERSLKVRARDIDHESDETRDKYLLALPPNDRRPGGSPAIVSSLKEFRSNFTLFSESSLVDLDWNNIVAAGSSVVTSLLPVGSPHNESKKALRHETSYYHEKLAPASDVDLFLYGLNEEQAVEKIKQIETKIRDSILSETTTIRTKHAITIASQYPTRHVQIVLRLYKSVSEILTGFDVDCSCVAYDGRQVWASPRAVAAYVTQTNTIDLSRRSPSYENRLSKYSRRGFEAYWPLLDRSKIDPTIFERSFSRVMGLARLLVFEKLPSPSDRDTYLTKRRHERGRPPLPWNSRRQRQLAGNVKETQPDDVAEWVEADDVSNYHTFTVPYGPKYTPKRIEKLLFTKDLLLNAEWNKPKDRETNLHRHPAFFGSVTDVIGDCCGFCPKPVTDADHVATEEESKIFISGNIQFLKDDPGRQEIGSFNPITDDDWTEMAYVGNTARLCQAIVDGDLEHVEDWCKQEGTDVNRRDHTGRTPLQLATMSSTPEIVQCLINHRARLVARMVDGFTSLHIASRRGNVAMVKAILEKSEANEAEEARKEDVKKKARRAAREIEEKNKDPTSDIEMKEEADETDEDDLMEDSDSDSADSDRMTEGSFVKVPGPNEALGTSDAEIEDEPDFYDVNVLAWDYPVSPLHLAIMGGHPDVIELLVSTFGADVLLPVKLVDVYNRTPRAAILTPALALHLPLSEGSDTTQRLLKLGASSSQADMQGFTALQYVVNDGNIEILDILLKFDEPAAVRVVNHLKIGGGSNHAETSTPLLTAIQRGHVAMTEKLLEIGAEHTVPRDDFVRAYHRAFEHANKDPEEMKKAYEAGVEQPIILATKCELPLIVQRLLEGGVDVNTLPKSAYARIHNPHHTWHRELKSLLDIVRDKIKHLKDYIRDKQTKLEPPADLDRDEAYLEGLQEGTYKYWLAKHDLAQARSLHKMQMKWYQESLQEPKFHEGTNEKAATITKMRKEFEAIERFLLAKGAKTFAEIYPDIKETYTPYHGAGFSRSSNEKSKPYETTHKFLVPDLTEVKTDGYHQLFEAAWNGDIAKVKYLTLGQWGDNHSPLQIARQDLRDFSPFSIAVLRGDLNLARVVMEIATVQYQPTHKRDQYTYTLEPNDEDDEDGSDRDGDDGSDDFKVISRLVNEDFTIDDIGALADSTKSKVSPMEMLTWDTEIWRGLNGFMNDVAAKDIFMPNMPNMRDTYTYVRSCPRTSWPTFHELYEMESEHCRWSLIRYAIAKNDMPTLQFLTEIGNSLAKRKADDDSLKIFTCSPSDYDFAVCLGRTEMIGYLIAATGANIPLQKLVNASGVTAQGKPKYYQGLSVYGKKRKDWADQGRGVTRPPVEDGHPPLLSAAFQGNLDSTEYFMGDGPLRRCLEFAAANKEDKRVKTLNQAEGGIGQVLSTWLNARSHLAIHMAVMSRPKRNGSNSSLEYLIRSMPENIDVKSSAGTTPLQLAFHLNRFYAARILLAAGANQLTRNRMGENLIHTILRANDDRPDLLRAALSLLDQSLIPTMLLERCASTDLGSLTPLAFWIHKCAARENGPEILQILLEYSKGADLETMDGAGDYPLNYLVRTDRFKLTESVIKYNPSLIYKESAVGMTPLDIVDNAYLRDRIDHPPTIPLPNHQLSSITDRDPGTFLPDHQDEASPAKKRRLMHEAATLRPGKRQIVSLFEANEVAKRLAAQHRESIEKERAANADRGHVRARNWDEHIEGDEVEQWMKWAWGFRKWDLEAFMREFEERRAGNGDRGGRRSKKRPLTPDGREEEG